MEALVKTNFFVSRAERDGLQKLARKRGVSAAALLRQILDSFLGLHPEPVAPLSSRRGLRSKGGSTAERQSGIVVVSSRLR